MGRTNSRSYVSNIRTVENLSPDSYDRSLVGTVVLVSGVLAVNVQGNVIAAHWADPIVVEPGDTVLVQLMIGRTGNTEAFVKAKVNATPRPSRAVIAVVVGGSDTVQVTGSDSATYYAYAVGSYTPVVGDEVFLSWFGSKPTVLGKVPATIGPLTPSPQAPPIAAPPEPPVTGSSSFPAAESSSYIPGMGWNRHGGGRGRVFQGNGGSGQVYGAWFYRGSPGQLSGREVTRLQIDVGARMPIGNYNAAVTLHFYLTSTSSRPTSGDVTRVGSPYDVIALPGQPLTRYDLPTSWGVSIIGGGGVAIALDPYCGFRGVDEQPESGKLTFDWSM